MPTIRITQFQKEHLAKILQIEALANPSPWSEKSFLHELTNPNGRFFVALYDGVVAGYGGIWLVIDEAHVTTIATDPVHRRIGIGQKLIQALLEEAKAEGMTCSTLEVRATNQAAISLYEKHGFKTLAVRKGYYPDNKEDACIMWLYDLENWKPS